MMGKLQLAFRSIRYPEGATSRRLDAPVQGSSKRFRRAC